MFEPVDQKANFPELERAVLGFWREADVFHRQLEQRRGGPLWIFYEGPPTANGQPAIHHTESLVRNANSTGYSSKKRDACEPCRAMCRTIWSP